MFKFNKDGTPTIYECGKCGKKKQIICTINEVPYCEDCFLAALGEEPSDGEQEG